jgi:hypothetical protein
MSPKGLRARVRYLRGYNTFQERLFAQTGVNGAISVDAAVAGTDAALLGFAGLVCERHLVRRREVFTDVTVL